MVQNSYIGLLDKDTITIKHPITKQDVKLFRVISLKSFRLEIYNHENPEEPILKPVKQFSIGGWVQSLDNLDTEPVWVDHRVRVFDKAKIVSGSLVTENCLIFGNSVIESSRLENYCRIHGDAHVKNCKISDLTEVKGKTRIENSILKNSSMVFEDAIVENCELSVGSCIRGKAHVKFSKLTDTSQIQGDSQVSNCELSGRSVILTGVHENQNYFQDDNLKIDFFDSES